VVSLEVRRSEVTELADVVFPVAPPVEKAGTFVTWEGRERPFPVVLDHTGALSDAAVLDALADELGVRLGVGDVDAVRAEIEQFGGRDGGRPEPAEVRPADPPAPQAGQAVLATWKTMLDSGRGQDGEPHMAATAPKPVARISAATASEIGVTEGAPLT